MLSEHTAALMKAQVSLLVLEGTQRSLEVRQAQRRKVFPANTALQRRRTRKTTMYTRQHKEPGEQREEKGNKR